MKLENPKNFTKKQKTKWLILFAILLSYLSYNTFSKGLVLSGKPPINFYKDGKLMWLIDTTSREYSLDTIEVIKKGYRYKYNGEIYYYSNKVEDSYENYLIELKSNPSYKYDNWRFPTPDELMRLDYSAGFFHKILVYPFKNTDKERSINISIFYDIATSYNVDFDKWSNTKFAAWSNTTSDILDSRGKLEHILVNFRNHRFPIFPFQLSISSTGHGSSRDTGAEMVSTSTDTLVHIRMVREREPWRLVVESIPIMFIWIFVFVMIFRIRRGED